MVGGPCPEELLLTVKGPNDFLFGFGFLVALWFELTLLGRCSTSICLQLFFVLVISEKGSLFLPELASNLDPPDLFFSSS
jgi:hypothetical protein